MVNNLVELRELLDILKTSGVTVFKCGDLQLVLGGEVSVTETTDDSEESETMESTMGFSTTDLRGFGVMTEFDEE